MPGSTFPLRVPIIRPSIVVKPMEVSIKMLDQSFVQRFVFSIAQKLRRAELSDESKDNYYRAGIIKTGLGVRSACFPVVEYASCSFTGAARHALTSRLRLVS